MSKIILVSRCAWTLSNFRTGHLRYLKNQGHTVIGAGAGGDGFEPKIRALGIPFIPMPIDRKGVNPASDLRLVKSLYQLYRKERPDIVHHFTIKPVIYGSLAARLARVPRIINTVTGLGFVFMGSGSPWLRRVVEMQYRLAAGCAHFTFFQNSDDLTLFLDRRLVKPHKAGLLPGSGIDTQYFRPDSGERANTVVGSATFLMAARLLRDKGIYEFVEAARLVQAEYPLARFQLLGGRDERNPTVVPQADLDCWQAEGAVEWLGQVDDVREPMRRADVIVLPSYREGVPRSLLEGAALGKPLITTDAVGCREVVDHGVNGYLVPVRDAAALADSMVKMIRDPAARYVMGCAGREKVVRQFEETLVIEKIVRAYSGQFS